MTVTIGQFGWWHIPAALEIEQELFHIQPWSEAQFWSELAAGDRAMFAAVEGDELVGYADIAVSSQESEIMSVGVREAHQGKGIGYALLREMLAASDAAGAPRVLLEAKADNEKAIALYERNGFSIVGHRPNYYALGVDAVLMERHV